jgi:cysteine synthase
MSAPLVRFAALVPSRVLYAKAELMLDSGSTYDRVAARLIDSSPEVSELKRGVVAGSGSLCLAFAAAAVRRRIDLALVCPEGTLHEHRMLLREHGLRVAHSPGSALLSAHDTAEALARELGVPLLYGPKDSEACARAFEETLGAELVADWMELGPRAPDTVIAPVGSGALLTGVLRALAKAGMEVRGLGVCAAAGPQLFEGMVTRDEARFSGELVEVSGEEAASTRRLVAMREGFLVGFGAAAAVAAGMELVQSTRASRPMAILVDAGDRYFSRQAEIEA